MVGETSRGGSTGSDTGYNLRPDHGCVIEFLMCLNLVLGCDSLLCSYMPKLDLGRVVPAGKCRRYCMLCIHNTLKEKNKYRDST